MRTALKACLWLAFGLEIISGIIWFIGINFIVPIIPLAATIALFIIHLRSYKEITHYGTISAKNIKLQTIFGLIVAGSFTLLVFFIVGQDCVGACTLPANYPYLFTFTLPITLLALIGSIALVFLPRFLNKRLAPQR